MAKVGFGSFGSLVSLNGVNALGTKRTGQISNRKVTHIVFSTTNYASLAKLTAQVHLRYAGRNLAVCPSLPLKFAASFSAMAYGQDAEDQALFSDLDAVASGDAVSALLRPRISFALPLGCIHLKGGDEMSVDITASTALLAADGVDVSWACLSDSLQERILKWKNIQGDTNVNVAYPQYLTAFRDDISGGAADEASGLDSSKLVITIEDAESSNTFGGGEAYAMGSVFGRLNGIPPKNLIMLDFDSGGSKGVPSSVRLSKDGTDATDWSFFVAQYHNDPERIAMSGVIAAKEKTVELAKQESSDDTGSRMLRHMGVNPKAANIKSMTQTFAQSFARNFK